MYRLLDSRWSSRRRVNEIKRYRLDETNEFLNEQEAVHLIYLVEKQTSAYRGYTNKMKQIVQS
jgi:hypothetical protein